MKIVRTSIVIIGITVHAGAPDIDVYVVVLECPTATTSHVAAAMVQRLTSVAAEEFSTTDLVQQISSGTMSERDVNTPVARVENVQGRSVIKQPLK